MNKKNQSKSYMTKKQLTYRRQTTERKKKENNHKTIWNIHSREKSRKYLPLRSLNPGSKKMVHD